MLQDKRKEKKSEALQEKSKNFQSTRKKKKMLQAPSVRLANAACTTRRQYASVVFRSLQKTEADVTSKSETNFVMSSFVKQADAELLLKDVRRRIDAEYKIMDKDAVEECCILPPLMWESSEDVICFDETDDETSRLVLVMCASGPIFPVVRVPSIESLVDNREILRKLFVAYETFARDRATSQTIASTILNATSVVVSPA